MKHGMVALAILTCAVFSAVAQQPESGAGKSTAGVKKVSLKGYVVDQMCAKGMAKKADPMQKAASHSKDCALEDHCSASGYGIFSDGKYYPFDEDGSQKAMSLIKKEKREKGLAYEVSGTLEGTTLKLSSIQATTLAMAPAKKGGMKKEGTD